VPGGSSAGLLQRPFYWLLAVSPDGWKVFIPVFSEILGACRPFAPPFEKIFQFSGENCKISLCKWEKSGYNKV
jgi:hypothetical protein